MSCFPLFTSSDANFAIPFHTLNFLGKKRYSENSLPPNSMIALGQPTTLGFCCCYAFYGPQEAKQEIKTMIE